MPSGYTDPRPHLPPLQYSFQNLPLGCFISPHKHDKNLSHPENGSLRPIPLANSFSPLQPSPQEERPAALLPAWSPSPRSSVHVLSSEGALAESWASPRLPDLEGTFYPYCREQEEQHVFWDQPWNRSGLTVLALPLTWGKSLYFVFFIHKVGLIKISLSQLWLEELIHIKYLKHCLTCGVM